MSKDLGKQKTENIKENFKDVDELGEKIISEGEKVSNIIGSIDTSFMDSDDMGAVESLKAKDKGLWDNEFSGEVESPHAEIKSEAGTHISDTQTEKKGVDDAATKMKEAGSASDIGSSAAAEGVSHMTDSSATYESIINETKSAVEQSEQKVANLKSRKGNLF